MEALDNPVWWSLEGAHASVAERAGEVARYPSSYAPFIAVADADADASGARELVAVGETVFFLGEIPRLDPSHWQRVGDFEVMQFTGEGRSAAVSADAQMVELGAADRADMLGLAEAVYPFFFRAHTADLGRYLGYRCADELVAMGGERMRLTGFQEVSTLCIKPEHARSGIAFRLFHQLVASIWARGRGVFAHCVRGNDAVARFTERALGELGGGLRATLPMAKVVRRA
ncbi:GNAT family N-acetyltransferase [Pseudenhygromyxa sp. WMMC2535]|uniref:GNAT family N-acetyltransferase n=1 Tax=Pseudenhygromyxa sp. WMMC2535 TaxID=2712867 RepID=UPI00155189EE|nr:GNAT family N-acetyltransferase [Pseudenhygromyxa sp. WMMC2535]NVB40113.1 GNAT family N-acetyltransferase [Pseudenhygromyxa sp. WMMC2535]